jgi:hypothetical protein
MCICTRIYVCSVSVYFCADMHTCNILQQPQHIPISCLLHIQLPYIHTSIHTHTHTHTHTPRHAPTPHIRRVVVLCAHTHTHTPSHTHTTHTQQSYAWVHPYTSYSVYENTLHTHTTRTHTYTYTHIHTTVLRVGASLHLIFGVWQYSAILPPHAISDQFTAYGVQLLDTACMDDYECGWTCYGGERDGRPCDYGTNVSVSLACPGMAVCVCVTV